MEKTKPETSCCAYSRIDDFYVFLKIKVRHGEEKGLKDAALPCFLQCFQGKEEKLQFQKLLRFVKEEQLYFPGVEDEDDFQTYALRFLEYGLENCEIPVETGGVLPEATPLMKLAFFPPVLENRTVPDTPASLQEKLRNHPRYLLLVSLQSMGRRTPLYRAGDAMT